jgi:hypothetical protein
MQSREAIMQALFTLVSGAAAFVTKSRRVQLWTDISPEQKPALFLNEKEEDYQNGGESYLPIVALTVEFFVYTYPGNDPSVPPATQMNTILDAIDAVLKPSPVTGQQTLGGLVSHCYIDGKIMKTPGDIDGEGLAVIPVKILATV